MIRTFLFYLAISAISMSSFAQEAATRDMYLNPSTDDFSEIQRIMESYFEGKDQGRGSGYKQWKRWEHNTERRLTSDGKITNWSERTFDEYHRYLAVQQNANQSRTNGAHWNVLAPTSFINGSSGYNPGIGRVNTIFFHPTDANTVYIGAPAGGLWKTTNGGTNWTNLTDGLPSIGCSGVAVDHSNTSIIYMLAGDGDGGHTDCIGVLKSVNGGETWMTTGLTFTIPTSVRGYKLIMSPSNSSILIAVTNSGLYRTTDAGLNWSTVLSGSFRDIEYKPGDPNTMYAVTSNEFYRSTNGGLTWTLISSGLPTGESRIALGVSEASPNNVYYLAGPAAGSGAFKGTYYSTDSGLNFSSGTTTPNILGYSSTGSDGSSQSTYDLACAGSATNADVMLTGGINVWRSTDKGATMSNISQWVYGGTYTHADIHAIEVNPLDSSVWCGSDGGIFKSTDDGVNWSNVTNDMQLMQFYKIAVTDEDANFVIGGTQDNGSNRWTGGSSVYHMYGADGMGCMIDHSDKTILYFSSQNGGLRKSTTSGQFSSSIKPSGEIGEWVTPYIMNPIRSKTIYAGYSDVQRSTDGGTSWTDVGSDGGDVLGIATNDTSVVYAGDGSTLERSDNRGASWTTISGGLPYSGKIVTDIAINPDDAMEIFVSMSGYTAGEKVFHSTNGGATWTNISGSLPNIPMQTIVFEDNDGNPGDAIYVGADVGVFYRDSTMTDWEPFMNGLPNVPIFDLEINHVAGKIRAGSFGRGLFESDLYTVCPIDWTLIDGSLTYKGGYRSYMASNSIISSRTIYGGVGTEVYYKAGTSVTLLPGFSVSEGSYFKGSLGPCSVGIPAAPVTLSGTYVGPMPGLVEQTVANDLVFGSEQSYLIYPNPFNDFTTIEYNISQEMSFKIYVTDLYGKVIQTMVDQSIHPVGVYKVNFDGSDLASGMYFVHLVSGNEMQVEKVLLR